MIDFAVGGGGEVDNRCFQFGLDRSGDIFSRS